MKRGIIISAFLFWCLNGFGGDKSNNQGTVILSDFSTLYGIIEFNVQEQVIIVYHDGKQSAYAAHQVLRFEIKDNQKKMVRRFEKIGCNDPNKIPDCQFYEVLVDGVVRVVRFKNIYVPSSPYSVEPTEEEYDYYVLYQGELTPMKNFDKEFYGFLNDSTHNELESYRKSNGLSQYKLKDQVLLISHFNRQLKKQTSFVW